MARRGFLLGKFMPPHRGHIYLCDFARAHCDALTILVGSLPDDPIPGVQRHAWMRELFPDCTVVHHAEPVPQTPEEHPEFWRIWRELIRRLEPRTIEFVFASETYGVRLAAELDARFVPVDPLREAVPVSGEAIRAAPLQHWDYLPAPVRPHFVKRVCLFGPESTGKTTLARELAERFGTVCAPEYGRTYTESFGTECSVEDLHRIAEGQRAAMTAAARQANRLLITDTDPLLTALWCEMLTGARDATLDACDDLCELYLLTGTDMAWTDDGTRYFPDDTRRERFMTLCREELERRGARFVELHGDRETRLDAAVAAIQNVWPALEG